MIVSKSVCLQKHMENVRRDLRCDGFYYNLCLKMLVDYVALFCLYSVKNTIKGAQSCKAVHDLC